MMVSSQSVQAGLSRPRLEVHRIGGPERRGFKSVMGSGSVLAPTAAFAVGATVGAKDDADTVAAPCHGAMVAA